MKELSIEEKAKRYDEALKAAIKIHNEHRAQCADVMTKVFPELKESEDDRVKNEIISAIKEDWPGHTDWIAWLEKQGEQKPDGSDKNKEMATGILNYLCFSTDATDLEGFDEWYDWLKSITKEGVLPQPKQEWSEEDEEMVL